MRLGDLLLSDARPMLIDERADLLALFADLSDEQWVAATEAGHWRVKDVALHLLDDDLGWLSRGRDLDLAGLLPTDVDYRDFVRSLDAKNERWVVGAEGLSRRLVTGLLCWSGSQVDDFYASLDLKGASTVIWAADGGVPRWFDLQRDLTERWIHQQQIRDAVDQPGRHDRFLPSVLKTFVWAFPHQYRVEAEEGTTVRVNLGVGGKWTLTRRRQGWELDPGVPEEAAAAIEMSDEAGWRQLTGLGVPRGGVVTTGRPDLVDGLLQVRGIIV